MAYAVFSDSSFQRNDFANSLQEVNRYSLPKKFDVPPIPTLSTERWEWIYRNDMEEYSENIVN